MSHTLKPIPVPPGLRDDPDAAAYELGETRIILSTASYPGFTGRMLSISASAKKRYPTVEEIAEAIVKVPEIREDSEWSMLWFGDGSISVTSSRVAYLFEGSQGRPVPEPE